MNNNKTFVSIVLFDDILYVYDKISDTIETKSVLDLYEYLKDLKEKNIDFKVYADLPYVLVPEKMYESGSDDLLLNQKYPHIIPSHQSIHVDTWTGCYLKCIYYVPKNLRKYGDSVNHLYTLWSNLNTPFFDRHSNALWSLNMHHKQYVFIKVNNEWKEVRVFDTFSPDDGAFHILKVVEPYRQYQYEFAVYTNEQESLHLSILATYIPHIVVERRDIKILIKELLASTCGSLQEI